MKILHSLIFLSYFAFEVLCYSVPEGYELKQIQTLFRHGDRVPDKEEIYTTDPYDDLFEKLGNGQLTKVGKQREYQIGEVLRERYGDFIGEYSANEVYGYSTNYDRTKMSLQLVLAGLYPPTEKTSWNDHILWSPIPTHYEDIDNDFLMNYFCPTYLNSVKEVQKAPEVLAKLEKYKEFLLYLTEKTGISTDNSMNALFLFQNVRSVVSMGLPLPDWCTDDVYKKLQELAPIFFDVLTHTPIMRKIIVGSIVERFLKNIKGTEINEVSRKVYMYSGHDVNVATFIRGLNITGIPRISDYGTTIVLEKLIGPDGEIYVRFFLWTGSEETWIPMKIVGCEDYICSLSVFEEIVKPIMPDKTTESCTKIILHCQRTRSSVVVNKYNFNPLGRLAYFTNRKELSTFKHMRSLIPKTFDNVEKNIRHI